MFTFYFDGHSFEYEARNTLRIFDLNIEVEIKELSSLKHKRELSLFSLLEEKNGEFTSTAELYKDDELIFRSEVKSCDIEIEKDSILKLRKVLVSKSIYNVLSKYYNLESEYGILTGVRPVKILFACQKSGKTKSEAYSILKDTYLVADNKIKLLFKVLEVEDKYINTDINKNNYNLYIGIPFCPSKCSYCSFTSYVNCKDKIVEKYMDTLIYEINKTIEIAIAKGLILNTIYVGGGTPSVLNVNQITRIFSEISKFYDLSKIKEISFEAGRPDTITEEKLRLLKSFYVNRISINPQTMNDKTLKAVGRNHSVDEITEKYNLALKIGFNSINMDIILGLPDENVSDVEHTIHEIVKLKPENVTVHSLSYKRGSALILENNHMLNKDVDLMKNMHAVVEDVCNKSNYIPYYMYRQKNIKGNLHNVGYTLKDKESIYNIVIIEETESILACGAGASSKILYENNRHESIHNFKGLDDYNNRINEIIDKKKIMVDDIVL